MRIGRAAASSVFVSLTVPMITRCPPRNGACPHPERAPRPAAAPRSPERAARGQSLTVTVDAARHMYHEPTERYGAHGAPISLARAGVGVSASP